MSGVGVLTGRVIVVTGAGRGLGRAYALDAAGAGAAVVANDVNPEAAAETVDLIRSHGGAATASSGSVSDWSYAGHLIDQSIVHYGRLDGLVNNAGVIAIADPWDIDPIEARQIVEVNLLGAIFVGTCALKAMRAQGSGSVVNATSSAQMGLPRMGVYGATKGALASLTYSWAMDMRPYGVRVNAFSPVADTPMSWEGGVEPGRLPSPAANAPAVTFLLSDLAEGITGQVLQRRTPFGLALVSHPTVTGTGTTGDVPTAEAVAETLGSLLKIDQQPIGWEIGRS